MGSLCRNEGCLIAAAIGVGAKCDHSECSFDIVPRRPRLQAEHSERPGPTPCGRGGARCSSWSVLGLLLCARCSRLGPGWVAAQDADPCSGPAPLDLHQPLSGGEGGLCLCLFAGARSAARSVGSAERLGVGRRDPPRGPEEAPPLRGDDGDDAGEEGCRDGSSLAQSRGAFRSEEWMLSESDGFASTIS